MLFQTACLSTIIVTYAITACSVSTTTGCLGFNTAYNTPVGRLPAAIASKLKQPTIDFEGRLIPIQKSKLTRRRAADSTDSTARRDNEVRLFFWIGIIQTHSLNLSQNSIFVAPVKVLAV